MINQCTLAAPVLFSGIGVHSGNLIHVALRPAESGSGIVFHRKMEDRTVSIKACTENVVDTRMATVLGRDGATVSTVEHLLATLYAFGIDNLHIDIDGPEVPIMDGSALFFSEQIRNAGIKRLRATRKYLTIRKPVNLVSGEKRITVIPSRFFRITFDIAFDHPCISLQNHFLKVTPESFVQNVAPARTFGFLHEYEYLKSRNLAKGASLENTVVVGEKSILNPEGLRFQDEFVRHKILDIIGDFSLLGYPILGHVKAYKSGHQTNHEMVTQILDSPQHWKLAEFSQEDLNTALETRPSPYLVEPALSEV
ncbi:MAG: UDP-3-O-acyl-N-acetylglucosamine deacetylase [Desulfuromonadaceae bacterium]|nr:UDP-3-O-acyl-N-acetylglucosamine deacetylase [Desulfuromonadaceae bacterium]